MRALFVALLPPLLYACNASPQVTTEPNVTSERARVRTIRTWDTVRVSEISFKHPADSGKWRVAKDTVRISLKQPVVSRKSSSKTPWRPLRHHGPFSEGSDFSQIQIVLHGQTSSWVFNRYFSTVNAIDDPGALDIYRVYYRNNIASDPLSSAVFPTTQTPVMQHFPGGKPPAFLNVNQLRIEPHELLLGLRQIEWSSRFGGSVVFRFNSAVLASPTQNLQHGEDFSYEFVMALPSGEYYYFDAADVELSLFVNPRPEMMNPKANKFWGSTTFGAEVRGTDVKGYLGTTLLEQTVTDSLFKEVARVVAQQVVAAPSNNPGTLKTESSRFAHAWIHNQHQGIIASNEKVTQIWISDSWLDLDTDVYVAYIVAKWQITRLNADGASGLFEGDPDWKVKVNVEQQWDASSAPMPLPARTLTFQGNDESGWVTLVSHPATGCTDLDHVDVKFNVKETDPLARDPDFGTSGRRLRLNCSAIAAQAALPVYGGRVFAGMIPTISGNLLDCDDEATPPYDISTGTFCLDSQGRLKGLVPGGIETLGEALAFLATLSWRVDVTLVAR